jgi:hypothetical protein
VVVEHGGRTTALMIEGDPERGGGELSEEYEKVVDDDESDFKSDTI